ncbi:MAG: hypothetical protein WCJ18_09475 [Planctomycetota bacterium]
MSIRGTPWLPYALLIALLSALLNALAGGLPAVAQEAARPDPVLERCLVSLVEEAKVPAREAGVLMELAVREGDVVRKVNSMIMTSQKRAEYFIGEFLQNRVSAIVFDIERDNKPQKLIYFIR